MTTKDQERKALEQIRKIVEGLGEDSYIGTAFEGCFEIAEQNIDNDFGCSIKQQYDSEFAYRCKIEDELKAVKQELREEKIKNDMFKARVEEAEARFNDAQGRIDKRVAQVFDLREERDNAVQTANEAQIRVAALEDEIIKLKAKLYDMMTGAA